MKLQIQVREALADDAVAILAHLHEVLAEPEIDLLTTPDEFRVTEDEERLMLENIAITENCIFLVALVDGKIVGELNCRGGRSSTTRHAVNLGMTVGREWRNHGVGTALMQHALSWARENPLVRRMELIVFVRNKAAVHLYEKFDFAVEGRRKNAVFRDGHYLDDFVMALEV